MEHVEANIRSSGGPANKGHRKSESGGVPTSTVANPNNPYWRESTETLVTKLNSGESGQSRDQMIAEIERRASHDVDGYQPGERDLIDKLKKGTLTSDEKKGLLDLIPENTDETRNKLRVRIEKMNWDQLEFIPKNKSEDVSTAGWEGQKAMYKKKLEEMAKSNGALQIKNVRK